MFVAPMTLASDLKFTERSIERGLPTRTSTTYIRGRRTRTESRAFNMFPAWRGAMIAGLAVTFLVLAFTVVIGVKIFRFIMDLLP